jgi:two-component system sensor histidine kinase/response regulator
MPRILAIDDDPNVLVTVSRLLQTEGYEVRTAADGLSGIQAAADWHPDLVLLDIVMPDPNGFAVLGALRRETLTASIPVVFLTGVPDPTQLRAGKGLGADDYLLKPFTRVELLHVIEGRLARQAFIRREATRRLGDLRSALETSLPRHLLAPLASLLGLSAFLRDEAASLPPELICELGQGIFTGSQKLQQSLEKIVFYAELERLTHAAGTTAAPAADRPTPAATIVTEAALAAAQPLDRRADLKLGIEDLAVDVDPLHLRRLVLELVENAAKFSAGGRPLAVECRREGESTCRLAVTDEGPGLPAAVLAGLDGRAGASLPLAGSGFGLAIVRRLASLYGAEISVSAPAAGGTTIAVALPLAP